MAMRTASSQMGDEPLGTSRLEVAVPASARAARAAAVLGEQRDAWLGEIVEGPSTADGQVRYLLDLELRVSDHRPRVSFRKAAFVDVGPLRAQAGGPLVLDISWRAAGLTPLFPVFAGTLRWQDGELRLDGVYAPPGGTVGAVADRLLLNVAARGTGRRLLERIAGAMVGTGIG
jgi:hypothetical protein